MDYHWASMTPAERQDAGADLGVGLILASRIMSAAPRRPGPPRRRPCPCSRRPSATARRRPPANRSAMPWGSSTAREERSALSRGLRIEPDRELTLRSAGRVLADLQRPEPGTRGVQKAIAVDPWRSDYHMAMARACAQAQDWPGAVAACREAMRIDPELFEARSLLIQCYLRSGEPAKADAEFRTLLRFYPASREVWEQWYEQQKQAAGRRRPRLE